ncbi:MAG: RecX family transcriptional regulator [Bacteroidales bacterium]|nr:RecX family transcriptional regulator [Bacteroidales bacterium]
MSSDKALLDHYMRLCSRREYCSAAVYKKICTTLAGKSPSGYPLPTTPEMEAKAAEIVSTLVKEGFISDARYASAYAREKAEINGWGPLKIKTNLSLQGVPAEIIALAIEGAFSSGAAHKKALKVISTKHKALKDDPQWRLKLLRFALSRGYPYEDAVRLIEECS